MVITANGATETNTFGTNYAGAFTYRFAAVEGAGGGGEEGGGEEGGGAARTMRVKRATAGRLVN